MSFTSGLIFMTGSCRVGRVSTGQRGTTLCPSVGGGRRCGRGGRIREDDEVAASTLSGRHLPQRRDLVRPGRGRHERERLAAVRLVGSLEQSCDEMSGADRRRRDDGNERYRSREDGVRRT